MEEEGQSQQTNAFPAFSTNVKEMFRVRSEINLTLESLYKTLLTFIEVMPENSNLLDAHMLQLIYATKKHSKQEIRVLGYLIIIVTEVEYIGARLSRKLLVNSPKYFGKSILSILEISSYIQ